MLYLNWLGNIFQIQKHTTHYFQNHSRLVHICESHETAVNMFLHWCKLFFLNATHSLVTFKAYRTTYIVWLSYLCCKTLLQCHFLTTSLKDKSKSVPGTYKSSQKGWAVLTYGLLAYRQTPGPGYRSLCWNCCWTLPAPPSACWSAVSILNIN